jgi:anti-sigma B factor antagonist
MDNFSIVTRTALYNPGVTVVDIEGALDFNTVGVFETILGDLFVKKQYKIVLNLEKMDYISSAGVGLLVGNIKDVRKNGGDIKIAYVNSDVYKVFNLFDLQKLFHILETEQQAVAEFGGGFSTKTSYV